MGGEVVGAEIAWQARLCMGCGREVKSAYHGPSLPLAVPSSFVLAKRPSPTHRTAADATADAAATLVSWSSSPKRWHLIE